MSLSFELCQQKDHTGQDSRRGVSSTAPFKLSQVFSITIHPIMTTAAKVVHLVGAGARDGGGEVSTVPAPTAQGLYQDSAALFMPAPRLVLRAPAALITASMTNSFSGALGFRPVIFAYPLPLALCGTLLESSFLTGEQIWITSEVVLSHYARTSLWGSPSKSQHFSSDAGESCLCLLAPRPPRPPPHHYCFIGINILQN